MKNDIIMFVNARELDGTNATENHRLPLIKSLARQTRGKVLVVTHYVSLLGDLWRSPKRILRHLFNRSLRRMDDNIYIYTPVVLFNLSSGRYLHAIERLTRKQIKRQLEHIFTAENFSDKEPKFVWVSHPCHVALHDMLDGKNVTVYDCHEHFSLVGFAQKNFRIEELEKKLAKAVDFVLPGGYMLTERLKKVNSRTYNFPHGVDRQRFSNSPTSGAFVAPDIAHVPSPRIGFCGCLKSCDNFELLEKVIRLRPGWSFVFVGETAENVVPQFKIIKTMPNVFYLGWRKAELLPGYLKSFDVGLIVSRVNELTNTFSPYKLFEYFGAGIPVVSTPIREVVHYKGLVETAETPGEFVEAIERCLKRDRNEIERKLHAIIETENWDKRAQFALKLFQGRLKCESC